MTIASKLDSLTNAPFRSTLPACCTLNRGLEPNAISNSIDYAKFRSRSQDAVIRVYDQAGNVIETHEHKGDFKEW
jgi:hypothetical protein